MQTTCFRLSYFDISSAENHAVHLFDRQLRCFGQFEFEKGKALVPIGHRVEGQRNRLDRTKCLKCLLEHRIVQFEIDTSDVNSKDGKQSRFMPLSRAEQSRLTGTSTAVPVAS